MTELNFERALDVLAGTPPVLSAIVTNLPRTAQDERPSEGAWSPREVLAHLLYAETTSMGPRVKRASEKDHLPYEQAAAPPPPAADGRQMSNEWADARVMAYLTTVYPSPPLRWTDLLTGTLVIPAAEPSGLTLLTIYLAQGGAGHWLTGDFDYSGGVNGDDYSQFLFALENQRGASAVPG